MMDDATQKLVDRGRFAAHYSDVRKISPDLVMDLCAALEAAQRPPVSPGEWEDTEASREEFRRGVVRIDDRGDGGIHLRIPREGSWSIGPRGVEALRARFSAPSQPVYDEEKIARWMADQEGDGWLFDPPILDGVTRSATVAAEVWLRRARDLIAALPGLTKEEKS